MPASRLRKPVRLPPKDLATLELQEVVVSSPWIGLSWPGRELTFSRNDEHRFSPEDARYEVLYLAQDELTAALEVFGSRLYKKSVRIPLSEWHKRILSTIEVPPVKIADLTYAAMAKARVTLGTLASCSRNVTHKWGRAVMNHPNGYFGLQYLSDYTGRPCLALFDVGSLRIPRVLDSQPFGFRPVADQLLTEYKVTLL